MPDIKEKPGMGKPKAKDGAMLAPKQAVRLLTEKYRHQFDQRTPGEGNEREYAADQVEGEASHIARGATDIVEHGASKVRREFAKEKISGQAASDAPTAPEHPHGEQGAQPHANPPKERKPPSDPPEPATAPRERTAHTVKERQTSHVPKERPQDARTPKASHPPTEKPQPAQAYTSGAKPGQTPAQSTLNNTRRGSAAFHPAISSTGQQSAQTAPTHRLMHQIKERTRTATTVKSRQSLRGAVKPAIRRPKPRPAMQSSPARQAARKARQTAQRQVTRRMTTRAAKAAKSAALTIRRLTLAVVKAAAAAIGAIAGLVGGGILLVVLLVVIVIAAVANSPFGLFFAAEKNAPDTVSVAEAVATVNMTYNAKLEELQAGDYDSIVIHGQAPDWPEVLAVFAVKLAGANADGLDVATLDADRVDQLTAVFWEMTAITTEVETIHHPGDGEDDPGWTEYILHITITAKTADDMRTVYQFTPHQNSALDELLADRTALSGLAGSLTITSADANAVLDALPDDLSPERREAVRTALQLVGKVNYFWGGKSYTIGWDSRWGTLQKVWADGSTTTGTYRPYGLDCSGFVDWIFNNSMGYIIGHGGGVIMQHTYCTDISQSEAQPGDLAFFPDDSHIGMVVGRNEVGGILVAHCSSGQNNVVVTEFTATGFTALGRPDIFH